MLALYRSGRQAEALQVYQQARRALLEELGIDPSQRLRASRRSCARTTRLTPPLGTAASEVGNEPRAESGRGRPRRRAFISIVAFCAIGGAVAAGLLLSNVGGGKAAAAFRPGTVLLDAKTRKQVRFLPPSQLAAPTAPVYAYGHVWLLDVDPTSFFEIDPATGNVLRHLAPPSGVGDGRAARPFAVGRHALWAAAGDDLVKIDPRLGLEVHRFPLDKLTKREGQA